ncbi:MULTISPECIES: hypothetical protein [unclassified Colwellia]|uniref:hypothetical protein n=1 Tax=unclassified Colwellia TaxID=196834 RepID=UPI0015F6222A|nr:MULTISPECIES: hypothetical protein [unclassified Colwellia]MBA6233094.1 hypothetical protein [Colwellia sp. MB02u-7]MBA6236772.1 hypothetical protein [Colwellia sp. MB02u-11]MBA6255964.1 hypothetical protein [Colwellia sp. MB3u-28]MBA6259133.1 hypothetical protein [Colwellia sp. MB3u-41]MBA6299181.1 hypothetical protein [Colwellia sp. MB3u-22]
MKLLSFTLTCVFTFLIAFQWYQQHSNFTHNAHQLVDQDAVFNSLLDYGQHKSDQIPTGVFIDSLEFTGPNDVHLSGYVWQEFSAEILEKHKPGVIFPNSIGNVIMKEAYRDVIAGITVVGWYFEVDLRQSFSYKNYPIDHKTVWLKILPDNFNSNLILVPSLNSYDSTAKLSTFGISQDIVLSGWALNESFFSYMRLNFDTDFGLHNDHPKTNLPELTFNIVIERDFLSAFMINITLLLVSIFLLYSLVLMMTSNKHLSSKFSASVSSSIGSCAAIFFVILIAHIDVRKHFPGEGIVYIEYFYLVSYFFIVSTAFTIYTFNSREKATTKGLFANDGILLKVSFWPIYTLLICLITWNHFY